MKLFNIYTFVYITLFILFFSAKSINSETILKKVSLSSEPSDVEKLPNLKNNGNSAFYASTIETKEKNSPINKQTEIHTELLPANIKTEHQTADSHKSTPVNLSRQHTGQHNRNNLKTQTHQHTPMSTESLNSIPIANTKLPSTPKDITKEETSNQSQLSATRKYGTEVKDFFQNTSKNNQNMAWKALAAFVGGIILWFVSICLTCWNEKRAVKVAELADYINDEKKVEYIPNGDSLANEKFDHKKAYIVSGKLVLNSEAKINGLNMDIKCDFGQVLVLKLKIDKFSKTTVHEERDAKDGNGNEYTEVNEKTYRNWVEVYHSDDNGPVTKYFYADCLIGGNYRFDCEKLKMVFYEKKNIANYEITDPECSAFQDYFKAYFKNAKFFIRSKSLYVITSNPHINDPEFNPQTFDFTEEDYKISIVYYYLPKDVESQFTAVGSLSPDKDQGIWQFGPYETDIKNAEFCYLCCCCESSSYMKLDEVMTYRITREKYYDQINNQNTSTTWILRLVCYLLHFASYYLILYPIIMILGMIPFLGAIGATVLIFVAFLISLMTFLFIIACAWACARPLRAIIIFGIIGILIFIGKTSSEQIRAQYGESEKGKSRYIGITGNELKLF